MQGKIAGEIAPNYVKSVDHVNIDIEQAKDILKRINSPLKKKEGITPTELRNKIHAISDKNLGLIKDGALLKEAVEKIEHFMSTDLENLYIPYSKSKTLNYDWIRVIELRNILTCLYFSAMSSQLREESRGEFYRKDYTHTDNDDWLKNIIIQQKDGKPEVKFEKPPVTKISLPKGKLTYQEAIGVATASLKRER